MVRVALRRRFEAHLSMSAWIRELGPKQNQIRWYQEGKYQHGPYQARNAWMGKMHASTLACGQHTRPTCHHVMPSQLDGGQMGRRSRLGLDFSKSL